MYPWKDFKVMEPKTPPNPRLERTGGRPIRRAGAPVAAGRSSIKRWATKK
jgi:hypothetical protein